MSLQLKQIGDSLEYCDENGTPCSINGEMIADASHEYSTAKLFEEFFGTPLGERFLAEYGLETQNPHTGESNTAAVERVFNRLYSHDRRATLSRITDTVQVAIDAGEVTAMPKPTSPPRGANGRFQTEHERLREEIRSLLHDPSVSAQSIRARAERDRAFGEAFRAEVSAPPPVSISVEPDEELEAFADAYTKAPSIKPVAGFVTLDGKKWPVADFNATVEAAISAGLLR